MVSQVDTSMICLLIPFSHVSWTVSVPTTSSTISPTPEIWQLLYLSSVIAIPNITCWWCAWKVKATATAKMFQIQCTSLFSFFVLSPSSTTNTSSTEDTIKWKGCLPPFLANFACRRKLFVNSVPNRFAVKKCSKMKTKSCSQTVTYSNLNCRSGLQHLCTLLNCTAPLLSVLSFAGRSTNGLTWCSDISSVARPRSTPWTSTTLWDTTTPIQRRKTMKCEINGLVPVDKCQISCLTSHVQFIQQSRHLIQHQLHLTWIQPKSNPSSNSTRTHVYSPLTKRSYTTSDFQHHFISASLLARDSAL